jgi:hypothetical protein
MARVDWAQLATKPLARTGRVRCASWKHRTLSLLRTRSIIAMPVRRARETCCFAADGDPCTVPEAVRRIFATHVRGRDRSALPLHSHVQASWSRWALPHHRHAAGASSTLSAQTCRSLLCPALRLHLGRAIALTSKASSLAQTQGYALPFGSLVCTRPRP